MGFPGEREVDYLANVTFQIQACFPVLHPPFPAAHPPNEVHLKTWEERGSNRTSPTLTQEEQGDLRSILLLCFPSPTASKTGS